MVNGISKSETIWLTHTTAKGDVYYITANKNRDIYYLYKMKDGKAEKIAKGKTPPELEAKYIKG